jgi:hypothetical protein
VLHVDTDVLCPGIEGVLNQFFHHTCGALDDLTGGDLLLKVGWKNVDVHWGA